MRHAHLVAAAGACLVAVPALAACGKDDTGAKGGGAIAVTATDSSCEVAKKELAAGASTFKITNKGTQSTEVEVLRADGKIVSEKENIGPGTGVTLTVQLSAGKYRILCSPGMTKRGPSQEIAVSGQENAKKDPRLDKAVADYRAYVLAQVDDTLAKAKKFTTAFKKGDTAGAKALYPQSRIGWERVEPVAESFGDIDPKVDLREADLEKGATWTGWHRLEKALWKAGSTKSESKYADQLIADLQMLRKKVGSAEITAVSMANGAKELLDEVATGKVTGEEEAFSHTDLWDFKANVDGAEKVYTLLRPVVQQRDAELARTLDGEFAKVQHLLKRHEKDDGYVSYDTVGKAERKTLSDAVNALGEPLSKLAGVVAR